MTATSETKAPSRGRRRVFALLAFLLPFAALLLLEGGLRLSGFERSHPLFVPVVGSPEYLRDNHDVVRRFVVDEEKAPRLWLRPVFFRRDKTPDVFRIFVQGGSTAEGYPYGYTASPTGMLQQRLQRTFPEREIEVITTAMSAVNTYTLLDFSGEILEQQPDAVVIYVGHNEYVGIFGVGSGYSVGRRPAVLAFLYLKDWKVFQLGKRLLGAVTPAALTPTGDAPKERRNLMATIVGERKIPYGSSLYRRGLEQYRTNLRVLLRRYREAGVPVFIGTVVANERDQPPFTSGHGPGADVEAWGRHREAGQEALEAGDAEAALVEFDAAVAVDDLHAEGHFARGQALEQLGRYDEARAAYLAAKDRDELRFRAPEEVNEILREVAADEGAHVVEVEEAFVRAAENGIVGHDLMLEHLHPNVDGYFVMADAFYEALRDKELIGSWEGAIPREVARSEVPVTAVDRLYGEYRIQGLTADWPFSERKTPFRLEPAASREERIAQFYYRGKYRWPDAMRKLLDYYRMVGNDVEAARVAVLLAEGFPNLGRDQRAAVAALEKLGRPDVEVYRRRAREIAAD